jgi:excisionase family DNA binding protein
MPLDPSTVVAAMTMPGDTPVWLTVAEAALRARGSRKAIYRAVESGKLRHATMNGRGDLRFRPAWVDAWLEASATPIERA